MQGLALNVHTDMDIFNLIVLWRRCLNGAKCIDGANVSTLRLKSIS